MSNLITRLKWRCPTCQALLGIFDGVTLDIRRKTAAYAVRGKVTARCRHCGERCEYTTQNPGSVAKPKPVEN